MRGTALITSRPIPRPGHRPAGWFPTVVTVAVLILLAPFVAGPLAGITAHADDRYAGYYYPEAGSAETFGRKLVPSPPANKALRVGFVTTVTKAQLAAPESPRFVIFAKGDQSEHLIMVALDDEIFATLYRARAVLAQLTSNLRGTEFFASQNLQTEGTFFDMLQIMNFESLVISDGVTWSHRVNFVR